MTYDFEKRIINGVKFRICYYYQLERWYGGAWHEMRDSVYRKNRLPVLLHEGEKFRLPYSKHVFRVKYLASVELQECTADLFSGMRDEYLYIRKSSRERYAEWSARCSELGLLDLAMINMRESFEACSDSDQPLRL